MELTKTTEELGQQIEDLQQRLEEANDTIEAIRTGKVDALVVKMDNQHLVYTLKSADQTYRVLIEKMIEGAITLNKKGLVLYSNSRFAQMMNLPLTKIIGSHFENFVPGEYKEKFQKLVKKAWQEETKGEIYLPSPGKGLTPFLISLTRLELDEGTALSLILTDLSLQKKTEKELQEKNEQLEKSHAFTAQLNNELELKVEKRTKELLTSREYFKFLADTIPVIVWTATAAGDYDYFNQQWYNYTGRNFEDSKGKGWQSVIHPGDLPLSLRAWENSIRTGQSFELEDRKRSVDGTYRWHLVRALPFRDTDGNIVSWFGVCTDIEDQKQAMEKKDEFIAMASHELKTPLTSLKIVTQLLMMDFEASENAMASSLLSKMDKQITKLTSLIGDLLDVSKANSGQLTYQNEEIDFNELVIEIADDMQRTNGTHKIEIDLADTEIIEGDRSRLGQVMTNLVSNAMKYSPKADKIIITSTKNKEEIRFCVQDSGIGIPASQQSKIFTRFFRVLNSKSNTFPGLGLGLYICNEIVKRHSGTMGFESEEGMGSSFWFTLPLKN
jgi:two-component system phosphate regulon sensor histidine kinase PhoR